MYNMDPNARLESHPFNEGIEPVRDQTEEIKRHIHFWLLEQREKKVQDRETKKNDDRLIGTFEAIQANGQ